MGILICCSFSTTTEARWHFRGGEVHDPINEVKQKLSTLKESEKLKSFSTLKDLEKKWNAHYEEFKHHKEIISGIVREAKALRDNAKGILTMKDDAIKQIKELYSLDFLHAKDGELYDVHFLEKNEKRIDENHQDEIVNTADKASATTDLANKNAKETEKILNDTTEGVKSETQKQVLVEGMIANQLTANAMLQNQKLTLRMANDARERASHEINGAKRQMNEFVVQSGFNEETKAKVKSSTFTRMPTLGK